VEKNKKLKKKTNLLSLMKFISGTTCSVQSCQAKNRSLKGVTHPN